MQELEYGHGSGVYEVEETSGKPSELGVNFCLNDLTQVHTKSGVVPIDQLVTDQVLMIKNGGAEWSEPIHDNVLDKQLKSLEEQALKKKKDIDEEVEKEKLRIIEEYKNNIVLTKLIPKVKEGDWYYTVDLGVNKKTERGVRWAGDVIDKDDQKNCNYYHSIDAATKARSRMMLVTKLLTLRDAINNKYKAGKSSKEDRIYAISRSLSTLDKQTPRGLIVFVSLGQNANDHAPLLRFYTPEARREFFDLIGWGDILKFLNL